MKRLSILAIAVLLVVGCSPSQHKMAKPDGFKEITFDASDHRKVYADFYPSSVPESEKVCLMFHMADSNAGEYEDLETVVSALGYNCIAVDQRAGGDMWDRTNRTVTNSGSGNYLDAFNDMQGALDYAQTKNYTTIIVIGSSYSASLALKLASENPTVKAVVAMSPGEYMDDKNVVKTWAERVNVPIFFGCTPQELTDGRQELYDAIPSDSKVLVSLPEAAHGASSFISYKSKAADQYVDKLKTFLGGLKTD